MVLSKCDSASRRSEVKVWRGGPYGHRALALICRQPEDRTGQGYFGTEYMLHCSVPEVTESVRTEYHSALFAKNFLAILELQPRLNNAIRPRKFVPL